KHAVPQTHERPRDSSRRGVRTPKFDLKLPVHGFLQSLASGETRAFRRFDFHWSARARITTFARGTLYNPKISKPPDFHFAAVFQCRSNGVEGRIDGGSRSGLRHLGLVSHRSDELVFGHRTDPFLRSRINGRSPLKCGEFAEKNPFARVTL